MSDSDYLPALDQQVTDLLRAYRQALVQARTLDWRSRAFVRHVVARSARRAGTEVVTTTGSSYGEQLTRFADEAARVDPLGRAWPALRFLARAAPPAAFLFVFITAIAAALGSALFAVGRSIPAFPSVVGIVWSGLWLTFYVGLGAYIAFAVGDHAIERWTRRGYKVLARTVDCPEAALFAELGTPRPGRPNTPVAVVAATVWLVTSGIVVAGFVTRTPAPL